MTPPKTPAWTGSRVGTSATADADGTGSAVPAGPDPERAAGATRHPPAAPPDSVAPVSESVPPGPLPAPDGSGPGTPSSSLLGLAAARNASPVPGTTRRRSDDDSSAVTGNRAEASQTPAGASLMAHGSPPAGSRAHEAIAAAMTEAQLEEHVRELCKDLGITRIHVYLSRGTTPGVPDDILIGPRGILWRECKTMRGKVTPAQQSMGEALLAAGQDWGVWRPDDLLSGEIAEQLAELAGLRGAS